MKALITGASGFIGSTLIEELAVQGVEVHALLRRTSDTSNLKGLNFQRVDGDLGDIESLKRAVREVDVVFHLAGVTAAPTRAGYFKHNAEGTGRLAQAVSEANPGLKRMIYVSSLAAGGPAKTLAPRKETDGNEPVSAYGESKLQGEVELLRFRERFPVAIVRPPMVYGPKDKGFLVPIQTVAKNVMPLLQGATRDGNKYYSLIHARDLCRGISQIGLAPQEKVPSGEVFYLSADGIHTYRELLRTIATHLQLRKPFAFPVPRFALISAAAGMTALGFVSKKTFPLNLDKLNEILPDYWICSSDKAKVTLGFTAQFDLNSGMQETIRWYKQERWI